MKHNDHPTNSSTNGNCRPNETGRTLLAGVLGGLASALGYLVYSRLPEEQRERLHQQVRTLAESRIDEIRKSLNF
jgi:hypothetical protein